MSSSRAFVPFIAISLIVRPSSMMMMMESSKATTAEAVAEDATPSSPTDPTIDVNEHKLLHLCKHPDYRTYIRCLNRQKRHHLHNEHDASETGEMKRCFDDCGLGECESTKCFHECNKRCMKKTKETHQVITQWEVECASDECKGKSARSDLPITNVTTNIDINNVINNLMPSRPKVDEVPHTPGRVPDTPGRVPDTPSRVPDTPGRVPDTPGRYPDTPGRFPNGWPCSWGHQGGCFGGLPIVPQISLVPQITLGLGFGGGGGISPSFQPGGFECSYCGNPFLRYRCDVSCYHGQGPAIANVGRGMGGVNMDCVSPHCVGGGG